MCVGGSWNSLKVKVAQSCLTLCDPMDYTVHGILWARILEWVAIPFSRGSSQPRDRTQVSHIAGRFLTSWATREALIPKDGDLDFRIWMLFREDVWLNKLGRMLMGINPIICPSVSVGCRTKFWPGVRMPRVGLVELRLLSLYPRWLFSICTWVAISSAFWWHGYPE